MLLAFKMEGAYAHRIGIVSRKWKRQRNGDSLRASRRNAACCYLKFSSEGPIFDF